MANFWSVMAYDTTLRAMIQNEQGLAGPDDPIVNDDGSIDMYFGPKAPAGKENQWIKTIPGKGWFTYVRMYGPEDRLFDGTYKLPDIEKLK